ncbi:unnamed protein product [Protopolystoma xenopodis]|uniref:Uncharacterized protein n=1 Tax=Protopolystoma xenopodis TaxID=117903 RepID=A0A448WNQ4_9PLAT|nr:unnamed protein product [Protopolystoma xenopodis]
MMVANSSNLIITVKPVNQNTCLPPRRQAQSGPLGSIGSPIYGGGNSTEPLRTGLSSGPQRNSGRNAPSGFVGGMSSNHKLHSPTSDIAASQSATHRASPVAISKPASGWSSLSSDQLTRSARGNGSGRALPHTGNQQPQSIYPSGTLMNGGRHDIHLDENTRTPDDRKNQYITVSAAPKNTATRLNSPHSMGPVLDGRNIVQHVEEKPARGCDNVGLITL